MKHESNTVTSTSYNSDSAFLVLLVLFSYFSRQVHHDGSQHARSSNNNPHLPIRRKTLGPLGVRDPGFRIIASWREFFFRKGARAEGGVVEGSVGQASDYGEGGGGLGCGEEGW